MEYSLKPLSKACFTTGKPLVPGSLCYSVLIENHGRFERQDYSVEGWNGVPENAIGVWRTEVPRPLTIANPMNDLDALFEQFAQLTEQANDQQRKMRYVLALWLIRKKRLILEETRETTDQKFMVLSGSHGEGPFEIPEEPLSEFEIARLQAELPTIGQSQQSQAA